MQIYDFFLFGSHLFYLYWTILTIIRIFRTEV